MKFPYIATSSKLLRTVGCHSEEEAAARVIQWNKDAPCGQHDAEAPATYYTWGEWCRIAEENDFDPMEGVENK